VNRLARSTEQAERVKAALEAVGSVLSRASRQVSFGGYGSKRIEEGERDAVARQLADASREALKTLDIKFEDTQRQEHAKHFLTRIKNLTKMLNEYVKAPDWASLEAVLKKQDTKSKSAYEKFFEYAKEAHGLVDFFDTEHEGNLEVGGWSVALFTSKSADWTGELIGKLKHVLTESTAILKKMGVGAVAGGKVLAYPTETLPGAAKSHDAYASYNIPMDKMWLSVAGAVEHVVHSLVHESGHRVYYKLMSGNAREAWAGFFESESGPPDVDKIIKAWEDYAGRDNWEAQKYGRYTPYFAGELKKSDPDMLMWLEMVASKLPKTEDFDRMTGSPKKGSKPGLDVLIENRDKIKVFLHPVSAYSGKNPEELFAEVFATWGVDGPGKVPEIVRDMFTRVLPQVRTASAERVAHRFEAEMLQTAVIRHEKGKGYCVRSPNNPDWNGGCYDSKGEAERRLKQVEYFKRQADTVWMVRDWDNHTEYLRDCVWSLTADDVKSVLDGTSIMRRGNPKVYKSEAAAMREFERRMEAVDAMMLKSGLYRHMHGDGRIIYVSIPDYRR
jgi:hypothetical protein